MGYADVARLLLEHGADVNARDDLGDTPLHEAAHGHVDVVRLLLEHGADVNARDKNGQTPLHEAASWGVVRLLPDHGADVNTRDKNGRIRGLADVVRLLLERGADVNARDEDGRTPLHWAAFAGYADVARLLLEHGADVNARNKSGETPLHVAAAAKVFESFAADAEFARLLLERGADPSIRDEDGRTPLDVAREEGHKEVVRVIEEYMQGRRGVGVEAPAAPVGTPAQQPAPAAPSIVSVECPGLRAGEWGRLLVRVRGSGTASLSLEGDVEWINPEVVELSGEAVVEVPVRPRAAGEVPVKVRLESSGSKSSKIVWLKVAEKAGKCPACGAPAEPGAKYCWRCGAKLS
jgi:hypothetical protein